MRKYHRLILLLLVFTVTASARKTILCGHFNYPTGQHVSVQYYASPIDEIERVHTYIETKTDLNGNFRLEINIDMPVSIAVRNGEDFVFYNKYINPGDSLWLGLGKDKIDIQGVGEQGLATMFDYDNRFIANLSLQQRQNSFKDLDPMDFATYWTALLDSELSFIDRAFLNNNAQPTPTISKKGSEHQGTFETYNRNIPESYRNAVRKEIIYDAAISLVQYGFRGRKGNRNILSDTAYLKYLAAIPYDDPSALASGYYLFFLRELPYNMWGCKNSYAHYDSATVKYNSANQYRLRDSIAKIYFRGVSYDFALYTILFEQVERIGRFKGSPDFESEYNITKKSINDLSMAFNNKELQARLQRKLSALKNEDKPAPDFFANTLEGKKVKLSDFKGKVVYVDFWATNCAPCVAELPYIKKLQDKFRDKDVVFLYVSFDHSRDVLKRFLADKGFDGMHLIDGKGLASDAAMKYNISGIPQHILVGKTGLLISADAPRPSSKPEDMIDRALAQ